MNCNPCHGHRGHQRTPCAPCHCQEGCSRTLSVMSLSRSLLVLSHFVICLMLLVSCLPCPHVILSCVPLSLPCLTCLLPFLPLVTSSLVYIKPSCCHCFLPSFNVVILLLGSCLSSHSQAKPVWIVLSL